MWKLCREVVLQRKKLLPLQNEIAVFSLNPPTTLFQYPSPGDFSILTARGFIHLYACVTSEGVYLFDSRSLPFC